MPAPLRILLPLSAALLAAGGAAGQPPGKGDARAEIARRLEVAVEDVKPAPVTGLYEIRSGAEVGYVSVDGRYYVDGDVFDMQTRANLTEARRQEGRLGLLAGLADGDAIVFAPAGKPRHTLTVFTDIDCTYCRRMHQEMAELNRLGIRVRYLLYPRGGPGTESWKKAEAVWCSGDRREALTRAKRGEAVKAGRCESPVAAHYALGREMGIRGTPGVITDRGEYLAGYLPAPQLAEYLAQPPAVAAAD